MNGVYVSWKVFIVAEFPSSKDNRIQSCLADRRVNTPYMTDEDWSNIKKLKKLPT